MSVRKRIWTTTSGKKREAFVVDYGFSKDGKRQRAHKTFTTEREAKAFRREVEQTSHRHIPTRSSITVSQAADVWLEAIKHGTRQHVTSNMTTDLEPASLRQIVYRIEHHI